MSRSIAPGITTSFSARFASSSRLPKEPGDASEAARNALTPSPKSSGDAIAMTNSSENQRGSAATTEVPARPIILRAQATAAASASRQNDRAVEYAFGPWLLDLVFVGERQRSHESSCFQCVGRFSGAGHAPLGEREKGSPVGGGYGHDGLENTKFDVNLAEEQRPLIYYNKIRYPVFVPVSTSPNYSTTTIYYGDCWPTCACRVRRSFSLLGTPSSVDSAAGTYSSIVGSRAACGKECVRGRTTVTDRW